MVIGTNTQAFRSRIINFRDFVGGSPEQMFDYIDDGVIVVEDGKIKLVAPTQTLTKQGFNLQSCEHLPDLLCCAGFIDAHVHTGQLDVIASHGEKLLDWLQKYTFPAELKFADSQYAQQQSIRFLDLLIANGVTSALAFTTRFAHHADHLFDYAANLDMRLIAGRVMMDCNAPQSLCDTAEHAQLECRKLIEKWHHQKRLGYAVTPRFAGTSTREQLTAAGKLLAQYPDVWMQTHLSESKSEIEWVAKLFPETTDYLNVYERFGLVTDRSIFAHCIHVTPTEIKRLKDNNSRIAFCPSSNSFLGSGLFPYQAIKNSGVPIALASDVGAGTSLSPFTTMGEAYKVCQLTGYTLDAKEAFYLSTLGSARSLHIDRYVGSLCPGKEADFIFINPNRSQKVKERVALCQEIEEEMFTYMILGDERLIERTYLHGELQFSQEPI